MKFKQCLVLVCIMSILSPTQAQAANWKTFAKAGVVGLAAYGAYKGYQALTGSESRSVHRHVSKVNQSNPNDYAKFSKEVKNLEDIINTNSSKIENLEEYVSSLDSRLLSVENDVEQLKANVKELKEEKIGKKVFLQELSKNVIIKRSLFDANQMDRLGEKEYSDAGTQCTNKTRTDLKFFLKDERIKVLMNAKNVAMINLDIIDSTNAIEDATPSIVLAETEEEVEYILTDSITFTSNQFGFDDYDTTNGKVEYKYLGQVSESHDWCDSHGYCGTSWSIVKQYQKNTYTKKVTPAYSTISMIVPLVRTASNEMECQSSIDADALMAAVDLSDNEKVESEIEEIQAMMDMTSDIQRDNLLEDIDPKSSLFSNGRNMSSEKKPSIWSRPSASKSTAIMDS